MQNGNTQRLDPALLGHILDESINEVYVFDVDSLRFLEVNEAARQNLGYERDRLRSMTPLDIGPELTAAQFGAMLDLLRSGHESKQVLHTYHERKDGSRYPVEARFHLATAGPRPVFVSVVLDLSERLRLQDQLLHAQRMETVGRLSGGLAHDLNNVLAGVLAGCRLARRRLDEGDLKGVRELSQELEDNVRRGTQLIQHLMDYSRSSPAKTAPVDVSAVVASADAVLRRLLGPNIELRVSALASGRFVGDPWRTEQAVMNLCLNARDAMPEGGCIWIETSDVDVLREDGTGRRRCSPGPHLMIAVRDTGVGMPAAVMARAFEPYYTTKREGKGTGLGLSTISQIVTDAEGFVELDSSEGEGTTFRLFFPRQDRRAVVDRSERQGRPGRGSGEQLLVVEGDSLLRAVMKELLEGLGYQALTAATPEQAIAHAEDQGGELALVLASAVLPEMGCAAMVERIRQSSPDVPVLYTSDLPEQELIQDGRLAAGSLFLPKPFTERTLAEAVRTALDSVLHA